MIKSLLYYICILCIISCTTKSVDKTDILDNNLNESIGGDELEQGNVTQDPIQEQVDFSQLHDTVLQGLEIYYPLVKQVNYTQDKASYFMVLTQNNDDLNKDGSPEEHSHIVAFGFNNSDGDIKQVWKLQDMLKKQKASGDLESNIYWLKQYCDVEDVDKDGSDEVYLVYATEGNNITSDGRLNIFVIYNGKKYHVKHQNGVLDFERETNVDPSLQALPHSVLNKVISIMEDIEKFEISIFPYGWKEKISSGATKVRE